MTKYLIIIILSGLLCFSILNNNTVLNNLSLLSQGIYCIFYYCNIHYDHIYMMCGLIIVYFFAASIHLVVLYMIVYFIWPKLATYLEQIFQIFIDFFSVRTYSLCVCAFIVLVIHDVSVWIYLKLQTYFEITISWNFIFFYEFLVILLFFYLLKIFISIEKQISKEDKEFYEKYLKDLEEKNKQQKK